MISGSLLALVLVTLLMLALKSIRYGIISLIPNALPAMIAFGIWGIILAEVNGGGGSVFIYTRNYSGRHSTLSYKISPVKADIHSDTHKSVEYAMSIVGKPIIVTSFVLGCGFTTLAMSDFNVNAYMGPWSITIFLALVLV